MRKLNFEIKISGVLLFGILLTLIFANSSCNGGVDSKNISEGEIEFQIEYLDNERDNPLIALLPTKMTTFFRENSSFTLIEGFFGTFKLGYILNFNERMNYSLLQILDKKYVYQSDLSKMAFGYQKMDELNISYTERRKKIAGYNCKHAQAIYNNMQDTVQLYYTDEINLLHPNLTNPFNEINGVLMEFTVNLANINMKFTADKVTSKNIDWDLFNLPKGYVNVSEAEMKKIIDDFNNPADK